MGHYLGAAARGGEKGGGGVNILVKKNDATAWYVIRIKSSTTPTSSSNQSRVYASCNYQVAAAPRNPIISNCSYLTCSTYLAIILHISSFDNSGLRRFMAFDGLFMVLQVSWSEKKSMEVLVSCWWITLILSFLPMLLLVSMVIVFIKH